MHSKAEQLLAGIIGSPHGRQLARRLQGIGRLDLLEEFYQWIDSLTLEEKLAIKPLFLHDYMAKHHPDVLLALKAWDRITS